MSVLCLDIGNTSAHFGKVSGIAVSEIESAPTVRLAEALERRLSDPGITGFAYCSVVPAALRVVEAALVALGRSGYALRHDTCLGLPIRYPRPAEIGQDRLANAIGAQALSARTAVIIDMGTATTLDVVTVEEGYLGGMIAPGMGLMLTYLHEKTAQLPKLSPEMLEEFRYTGQPANSTAEAMLIGCSVGFTAMIQGLLVASLEMLDARGKQEVTVFLTGSSAVAIQKEKLPLPCHWVPEITLIGLAEALRRYEAPKSCM